MANKFDSVGANLHDVGINAKRIGTDGNFQSNGINAKGEFSYADTNASHLPLCFDDILKENTSLIRALDLPNAEMVKGVKRLAEINRQCLEEAQKANAMNEQSLSTIAELNETIAKMEKVNKRSFGRGILIGAIGAAVGVALTILATKCGWL